MKVFSHNVSPKIGEQWICDDGMTVTIDAVEGGKLLHYRTNGKGVFYKRFEWDLTGQSTEAKMYDLVRKAA